MNYCKIILPVLEEDQDIIGLIDNLMEDRIYIQHIAGEMVDGVQTCVLCGAEISNKPPGWQEYKPMYIRSYADPFRHGAQTVDRMAHDMFVPGTPFKKCQE